MGISDTLQDKLKGFIKGTDPVESRVIESVELDDFETRDKVLKSMRRMRRRQMDITEKDKLRKDIDTFNQRKASKDFIGTSLFDGKINGLKGLKKGKKVGNQSFFNKGNFF